MRRTLALTTALLLALAGCSSSSDEAAPASSTEATQPQDETTTTTEPEWTSAMQTACTAEAEAIDLILRTYYGGPNSVTPNLDDMIDRDLLDGPLTHWDVTKGEPVGIDANEDGRCGGVYLP